MAEYLNMTFFSSSLSTQLQLASPPIWISPKEQCEKLYSPAVKQLTSFFSLIPETAKLVADFAADEWVTSWYKAQTRLNLLPQKIPPLPENIHQILDSQCPIYENSKIKDTHFLALVPKEFRNLNYFEEEILKPYGKKLFSKDEHPFQFRSFWDPVRLEYGPLPFVDTHWILMTKDVLPGSREKPWQEQVIALHKLSLKAGAYYEIPTLQQAFTAIMTHQIATGEILYQKRNEQGLATYTCVKDAILGDPLALGGFGPCGAEVFSVPYPLDSLGMAAIRKF